MIDPNAPDSPAPARQAVSHRAGRRLRPWPLRDRELVEGSAHWLLGRRADHAHGNTSLIRGKGGRPGLAALLPVASVRTRRPPGSHLEQLRSGPAAAAQPWRLLIRSTSGLCLFASGWEVPGRPSNQVAVCAELLFPSLQATELAAKGESQSPENLPSTPVSSECPILPTPL